MIKNLRPIFVIVAAMLLSASASSQAAMNGKVVGIVDGKTFVLEAENGRVTGTIQFIEVPEPEQPLSRIVREHFERLVLGKTVAFQPSGFSPAAIVGKMYLNGLDVGQQLVRDGAAWHLPPDRSGQIADESQIYDNYQTLAKAERRGIWSVTNLTPAWQFRAARRSRSFWEIGYTKPGISGTANDDTKNYKYSKTSADMWIEVGGEPFAQQNPIGQMFWGYDPDKKVRNISTPSVAQIIGHGEKLLEVEMRVSYLQGEIKPRMPNTAYVIGFLATSTEHNFANENDLVFVADGKTVAAGKGQRFWRESPVSVEELIQYKISRSDLTKIANAAKLTVRAGQFSGNVSHEFRETLLKLFEVAK